MDTRTSSTTSCNTKKNPTIYKRGTWPDYQSVKKKNYYLSNSNDIKKKLGKLKITLWPSEECTQLEESLGTAHGPLVEKHCPYILQRTYKFCNDDLMVVNWPKHVVKLELKTGSNNKNQRDALISQIYFGTELYMFRVGLLSIIRSLVLYTQQ